MEFKVTTTEKLTRANLQLPPPLVSNGEDVKPTQSESLVSQACTQIKKGPWGPSPPPVGTVLYLTYHVAYTCTGSPFLFPVRALEGNLLPGFVFFSTREVEKVN